MKTIYVVQGETGEYADRNEWPVRAFDNEKNAQDFILHLTKEYHEFLQKYPNDTWRRLKVCPPNDPGFMQDFKATKYTYFSVELTKIMNPIPPETLTYLKFLDDKLDMFRECLKGTDGEEFRRWTNLLIAYYYIRADLMKELYGIDNECLNKYLDYKQL